jgi:alpha-mannosidase
VTTRFDNPSRDHRLRAIFPLPERATTSTAECALATVTRGLVAEGGPHERGLATFPSRRFVTAGGLTVVHDGLLEYELIDGGAALALTLLRATGHLSRPAPAYRPNAAGPDLEVEGPQLLGPLELRYGVAVGAADPYALAEDAWLPLEVLDAPGGGDLGDTGSLLEVSGAQVSSLRRVGGLLELRVFNPSDEPAHVALAGRRGWLVDLRGEALEPFADGFALRPWGIATARLEGA